MSGSAAMSTSVREVGQDRAARAAVVWFAAIEVLAVPLLLFFGRRQWFQSDEWDFLSSRTAGNVGDWFRPHYDHWTMLPMLLYRLVWTFVGLRSYAPYQLLSIGSHLIAAALLWIVMGRAGVRPWLSTLAASTFVFFGAGAENVLFAFQITFVGALVFGLAHLLLADHAGPVDHRDWLGLGAGLAGLLCSGVAVTMVIVVGIATLLRRGWRIALLHTAPLASVYVIWLEAAPKAPSNSAYVARTPGDAARFVAIGVEAAFARLGQLPGLGVLLGATIVLGLALRYAEDGIALARGSAAAPLALLAGAVVFLVSTGIRRAGQGGFAFGAFGRLVGPEHARQGRYVYLIVAMVVPAIALGCDAFLRRWRHLAVVVVALFLAGLPGNIHQFDTYAKPLIAEGNKRAILTAPRLPLARQLPRTLQVSFFGAGPTLGWLLDTVPSGKIPTPPRITVDDVANETLKLALVRWPTPRVQHCTTLARPASRVMQKGELLTVKRGFISVIYLTAAGGRSQAKRVGAGTFIALAGPLAFRISPVAGFVRQSPTILC